MWDNQFFQILVYSALIFFNLLFITGFIIALYFLIVIGSIKNKVDEILDQTKETIQKVREVVVEGGEEVLEQTKEAIGKVREAAVSASEAGMNVASFVAPLAIFKNLFGKKPKPPEKTSFFSKLFS